MPTKSAAAKVTTGHSALIEGEPRLESVSTVTEDLLTIWLKRHLQQSCGAIAAEPIPEGLLQLIQNTGKS